MTRAASIVLYGVGSPLVVDVEETCLRAGIAIAAGVRNVDAPVCTSDAVRVIAPDAMTDDERACPFVVGLFTPGHRRSAVEEALHGGLARGATLVDPTSPVARSARLGEGVYVNAGAVVAGACELDDWVIVNRSASLGHHVRVGAYASIGPGAVLCGHVLVGRGAVIGAGSVVLPKVEIGSNAVIAAGSVVRESVPADTLVEGNPCRVVRSGIRGYAGLAV